MKEDIRVLRPAAAAAAAAPPNYKRAPHPQDAPRALQMFQAGVDERPAAAPRVRRHIVEDDAPNEAAVLDSDDEAYATPDDAAEEAADADPNSEGSAMEDNRSEEEMARGAAAAGQTHMLLLLLVLLMLMLLMLMLLLLLSLLCSCVRSASWW